MDAAPRNADARTPRAAAGRAAGRGLLALALALGACGAPPPPMPMYEDVAPTVDQGFDAVETLTTGTTNLPRVDYTFVLAEGDPEQTATFGITARAGRVDLHLLIDSTGSFSGEIHALQRTLTQTVMPSLRARIPSLTVGVSSFEDMPFLPYGTSTDKPFVLYSEQTSDAPYVEGAVYQIYQGDGADRPEAWAEALWQIATGRGLYSDGRQLIQPFRPRALPDVGTLAGVGFRDRSTRAVVLITDAPPHEPADYGSIVPGTHSLDDALTSLEALHAHVLGVAAASDIRPILESVAFATGAYTPAAGGTCATGLMGTLRPATSGMCPLVFDLAPDGTGLSDTLVGSVTQLLDAAVYQDVHAEAVDDAQGFVHAIEAVRAEPAGAMLEDLWPMGAPDGIDDTFANVDANTSLTFRLHVRNDAVPGQLFPQVFYVHLNVYGDGVVLREIVVRVIVPEGPKFDAGMASDP